MLRKNSKTANDVLYVAILNNESVVKKQCSWQQFVEFTESVEYYKGLSSVCIDINLTIVGHDWWLSREANYSIESWRFNILPKLLEDVEEMTRDDVFTMPSKIVNWNAEKYEVPLDFYTSGKLTKPTLRIKK